MSSIVPIGPLSSGALSSSTPSGVGVSSRVPETAPAAADAAHQSRDPQAAEQASRAQRAQDASVLRQQIEQTLAESRVQTNLRFRVDEEARRIVVSVVDSDTGETIMQIPDEAALNVARRLAATGSGLLDQEA